MTILKGHIELIGRATVLAAVAHYQLVPALAPNIWPSLLVLTGALAWSVASRLFRPEMLVMEVVLLYLGAIHIANAIDTLKRLSITAP